MPDTEGLIQQQYKSVDKFVKTAPPILLNQLFPNNTDSLCGPSCSTWHGFQSNIEVKLIFFYLQKEDNLFYFSAQ